jgi:hypothetical protein
MSGETRLRATIARVRGPVGAAPRGCPPLKPEPTNPFELAVAERLATLKADIDRVESRLNWLFALIIGAAVTNVVIALLQ